jgi:tetratricopeptide (TPR) repeat protein
LRRSRPTNGDLPQKTSRRKSINRNATPRLVIERIEAERAESEAARTSNSATLEQRRRAIANYERALALWRELGERREELRILQILGNQYSQLGALEIALNYRSQAIQIARSIGDRDQEASLLVGLGSLHKDSGNFQKALDNYSQARQIFASSSSRFGEALAIEAIGVVYLQLGDPQRAIENFTQSAPIFSSMGIKSRECNALNNLGVAYRRLGKRRIALGFHKRALAIARESGDAMSEAQTIGYKGDVYYAMGDARQPKKGISASQHETLIAEADVEFRSVAARMSQILLSPIASKLRQEWKGKRLVIVASGAMEYVPFAALPHPSAGNYRPLIVDHEVVNLPSATALAMIRRETPAGGAGMKTLAMLADPVFEANDPRLFPSLVMRPKRSRGSFRKVLCSKLLAFKPTARRRQARN